MNELIWIGNTLYPRWYVISVVVGMILVPFVLALIIHGIIAWKRGNSSS